jgi:D-sedoheptulose 7-phosphate isomerase
MTHSERYLQEAAEIIARLDRGEIERVATLLAETRARGGRLFLLGVGGSAANCSHAVNDFRKLAGFEAYAPTDNVSELTARTNDEGWDSVFVSWLKGSRLGPSDALFVLSVGGGDRDRNISASSRAGVGRRDDCRCRRRDGGFTAQVADGHVADGERAPPREAFQPIWHLLVSQSITAAD